MHFKNCHRYEHAQATDEISLDQKIYLQVLNVISIKNTFLRKDPKILMRSAYIQGNT